MRIIRWLETAVLGASVAGACAAPAAAGDNAATPPSASTPPAWQMVIAPRHGPAVVVDFPEEADGSLSAQQRVIRPGEHIGGPLNQQLAPLPTPVENPPVQGPALSPDSAKRPTPVRRKTAEVETRKNPFRLIGQESEAIDNAAEKGPLLPEPPPPLDPIPEAVQEPKPSNVVPAPMVTKPKPPALPDENVVPPQPPAEEKPAEESPDAASSEATSPEEAGVAPDGSALPAWPPGMGHRPSYADIYFSIPFLRTEYDAHQ